MKRTIFISLLVLLFAASTAFAAGSPIGKWKTIDDKTKKEKSIVEIYSEGGKLYGKILELLQPEDKGKICDKCPGADKNKPTVGLIIIKGLQQDGDEYAGGTILDPKEGKIYKCKIEVLDNGNKLKVRGFIGFSLIGRNQFWYRVK
jgi:uncharacterized protein (DUF2147 family)